MAGDFNSDHSDDYDDFGLDDDLCLAALENAERLQQQQQQQQRSNGFELSHNASTLSSIPAPLAAIPSPPKHSLSIPKSNPPLPQASSTTSESLPSDSPEFQHPYNSDAIQRWIYPTNYSFRDYQFNISKKALFNNTLVSLPTGLGKTLIAAVVMINFQKWFPQESIIFMAPTRPLVRQQMQAFVRYFAPNTVEELTGQQAPAKREALWKQKSVFFITPQVFQNDLEQPYGKDVARKVVLLCVDEAHRATGNHAYCVVVRALQKQGATFRMLALSATPGSDLASVQAVIQNLLISNIEARTEQSFDIVPYTQKRTTEVLEIPLNQDILQIKTWMTSIIRNFLLKLCSLKVISFSDPERISQFLLLQLRDKARQQSNQFSTFQMSQIESDFALVITLCHAYNLLLKHGIRTFSSYLNTTLEEMKKGRLSSSKAEFLKRPELASILSHIEQRQKEPLFVSHPKVEKLVAIVLNHFTQHEESQLHQQKADRTQTRVMIFSEYRESVEEIVATLQQHYPLVRVMQFVGQATKKGGNKGYSQKEQMKVISLFQKGNYNVLVSTCIGEEGLDIGEVDLIICFDAKKSPIRMLQRVGRTGRKREGKICILVTQGKECESYKKSQAQYKAVQKILLDNKSGNLKLYQNSPRMLPPGTIPQLSKEEVVLQDCSHPSVPKGKEKGKLKSKSSSLLSNEDYEAWSRLTRMEPSELPDPWAQSLQALNNEQGLLSQRSGLFLHCFQKSRLWQHCEGVSKKIGHSSTTKKMVHWFSWSFQNNLSKYNENERFTQVEEMNTSPLEECLTELNDLSTVDENVTSELIDIDCNVKELEAPKLEMVEMDQQEQECDQFTFLEQKHSIDKEIDADFLDDSCSENITGTKCIQSDPEPPVICLDDPLSNPIPQEVSPSSSKATTPTCNRNSYVKTALCSTPKLNFDVPKGQDLFQPAKWKLPDNVYFKRLTPKIELYQKVDNLSRWLAGRGLDSETRKYHQVTKTSCNNISKGQAPCFPVSSTKQTANENHHPNVSSLHDKPFFMSSSDEISQSTHHLSSPTIFKKIEKSSFLASSTPISTPPKLYSSTINKPHTFVGPSPKCIELVDDSFSFASPMRPTAHSQLQPSTLLDSMNKVKKSPTVIDLVSPLKATPTTQTPNSSKVFPLNYVDSPSPSPPIRYLQKRRTRPLALCSPKTSPAYSQTSPYPNYIASPLNMPDTSKARVLKHLISKKQQKITRKNPEERQRLPSTMMASEAPLVKRRKGIGHKLSFVHHGQGRKQVQPYLDLEAQLSGDDDSGDEDEDEEGDEVDESLANFVIGDDEGLTLHSQQSSPALATHSQMLGVYRQHSLLDSPVSLTRMGGRQRSNPFSSIIERFQRPELYDMDHSMEEESAMEEGDENVFLQSEDDASSFV